MRHVSQRHVNGCGVAALAMITGISYKYLISYIDRNVYIRKPKEKFNGINFEIALMIIHFCEMKYRLHFDRIDPSKLKNDAYISINTLDGNRHAIVWDAKKKKYMDGYEDGPNIYTKKYVRENFNFIIEILDE